MGSSQEHVVAEVLAGLGKAGTAALDGLSTSTPVVVVASTTTSSSSAASSSSDSSSGGNTDHCIKSHLASSSTSAVNKTASAKDNDDEARLSVVGTVGSSDKGVASHHQKIGSTTGGSSSASSSSSIQATDSRCTLPAAVVVVVEPRVVQYVKISKSRQDHSYRDYSVVPPPAGSSHSSTNTIKSIEAMSFSEKLHDLLAQPEHASTIRWLSHGRAFHVDVPKNMEKQGILMRYFNHGRYSSFLRQLNNHGFKHLTVGPDRNSYYHECFLRGLPHLCVYMPPAKDARRLIPDPDNEPNFYSISKAYPLPSDVPTTGEKGTAVVSTKPVPAAAASSVVNQHHSSRSINTSPPPTSPLLVPASSPSSSRSTSTSTRDSITPPPLQAVLSSQMALPCIDRVTPFAAIFNQATSDEIVVPHATIAAAATTNHHTGTHQEVAAFQQQQFNMCNNLMMLPPALLASAMAHQQQHHHQQQQTLCNNPTSITNSLLAAITQDTLNFPSINNNTNNNSPSALLDNSSSNSNNNNNTTTTLNMLEALLVRHSQITTTSTTTPKHALSMTAGQHERPAKMARFDPTLLLQVPTCIAAPSWPTNDMDLATQRLRDVASSLASMEKFRSEVLRLEVERKKTEELQKTATANALAARAALLAAILSGHGGNGGVSGNNMTVTGNNHTSRRGATNN